MHVGRGGVRHVETSIVFRHLRSHGLPLPGDDEPGSRGPIPGKVPPRSP